MSTLKRVGELEINEDIAHERLEWRIERIGWVIMGVILLAALAGVVGPGPLSKSTRSDHNSKLQLEYERFARFQAPTVLRIQLASGVAQAGKVRLWISRDYIENAEVKHIDPEPESVEVSEDRMTYTFITRNASRPTALTYHLEPNMYGQTALNIGVEELTQLSVPQFIYP